MLEEDKENPWVFALIYPMVSALILGAAFPNLHLGFLSYVALIPLFLAAEKMSGRSAFGAGFLNGVVFFASTVYWIGWITPPGAAGAIFYLALVRGVLVLVLSRLVKCFGMIGLWCAPFLWVGYEYFHSLGDMGFTWMDLAYTQTEYLPLIQYAEFTGVYGISFWVVLVNVSLLSLYRSRSRVALVAVLIVFLAPVSQGVIALYETEDHLELVTVGLVQPDIPPEAKRDQGFEHNFGILKPLTFQASEDGAKLIIWPEAAVPVYMDSKLHEDYRARIQNLVDSLGVYLYTGANRFVQDSTVTKTYNSSFLLSPENQALPYYDKMKVVPFGERAPFPNLLPFLREFDFSGGGFVSGNFDSGEIWTVFQGPGYNFSGMICFDSIFPDISRRFVEEGAEFLVVITNDGWFGNTSGPYQHAEMSIFRAIENRRSIVRCANTGVSMFIDAFGRKRHMTDIFHPAVITDQVRLRSGLTVYTRYGDVFAQICTVLALMFLVVASISKPEQKKTSEIAAQGEAYEGVPAIADELEFQDEGKPMPFLEHLEELRWHLLKGLGAVCVGAVFCGIFGNEILEALTRPVRLMDPAPLLQTLKPMGMFIVKLNIALVGGAVLALPVLIYQLWLFVAPGLFSTERRYVTFIIFSSTVCFILGSMVAYWGVVPLSMMFLVGLTDETMVQAQFDIGFYISFVLRLLVAFGFVFELPVATFFLAKVGILTGDRMRAGRRYAILAGFVLSALLTPPDPVSQMMMALPLVLLYELSIWVASVVNPGGDD